jgi:choline dehydrogenase-like flavoprotein
MAASPGLGVVDQDCKVFGTRNLYIAGSSVFPTGGHAPPTLTIVQLALRLADHLAALAEQHGSGVAVAATSD